MMRFGQQVVSHVVEVEVVRSGGLWSDAKVVRRLRPEEQDGSKGFQESLVILSCDKKIQQKSVD